MSRYEIGFLTIFGKKNINWVILNWLTKFSHFIPIRMNSSCSKSGKLYILEVGKSHRELSNIVFEGEPRFTFML